MLKNKAIRIFWFSYLLLSGVSCSQESNTIMIFPEGLERINTDSSAKKADLTLTNKLVFYLDISERSLYTFSNNIIDWKKFSIEYPDVSVLIFLSGIDTKEQRTKEKMEEYFKSNKFPYEVFLDPEYRFYSLNSLDRFPYENKTEQIYYVKGQEILGISNFGMPKAREEELERFFGSD